MEQEFFQRLLNKNEKSETFPATSVVCQFAEQVLFFLFPEQTKKRFNSTKGLKKRYEELKRELKDILLAMESRLQKPASDLSSEFFESLPQIYDTLLTDVEAIEQGDPAAKDSYEVVRAYPGFYAIAFYRLAHRLCEMRVPLLPRMITEFAHNRTGIDIHPSAKIGKYFCIDHGTGVVIGETTAIGEHVKIYQGVTLGALSVDKQLAKVKRHPTIEDHVVIYSNATILGGKTTVGHNSIIGGNVWLTETVPAFSKVYHIARIEFLKSDKIVEKKPS